VATLLASSFLAAAIWSSPAISVPIYGGSWSTSAEIARENVSIRFSVADGSLFGPQTTIFQGSLADASSQTFVFDSGLSFDYMVSGLTNGIPHDTFLISELFVGTNRLVYIGYSDSFLSDVDEEIESDIASVTVRFDWFSDKGDECANDQCIYGFFQELNFIGTDGQSIPVPGHQRFIGVPEPMTLALLITGLIGVFASRYRVDTAG
jgi:hypothetical protein